MIVVRSPPKGLYGAISGLREIDAAFPHLTMFIPIGLRHASGDQTRGIGRGAAPGLRGQANEETCAWRAVRSPRSPI
jgi:hypothetical protein